jgi:hypothetical protein
MIFREAGCRAAFSGGNFTLTVEELPLTDAKLRGEWKTDTLWRVRLTAEGWTDGTMTMTVQ